MKAPWVLGSPDQKRERSCVVGVLLVGEIDLRNWVAGRAILPEITDNSDDLQRPRGIVQAAEKSVSQRVLAGKGFTHEGFVDDYGECRVVNVTIVEVPSTQLRNAKGGKRPWCDDRERGMRIVPPGIAGLEVSPENRR